MPQLGRSPAPQVGSKDPKWQHSQEMEEGKEEAHFYRRQPRLGPSGLGVGETGVQEGETTDQLNTWV